MKNRHMLRKWTIREIRTSLGRYLAILAIVALGVSFFCGLKITRPTMIKAANDYFDKSALYEYVAMSTLGYDDKSVEIIKNNYIVSDAEGSISRDIIVDKKDGESAVVTAKLITKNINKIGLISGRMPSAPNECLIDEAWKEEAGIGNRLRISKANEKENKEQFAFKEYEIVGTARSPLYLNDDRGTTKLGDGTIAAFIYMDRGGFDVDYYTEIYITADIGKDRFSEESSDALDYFESSVRSASRLASNNRLSDIIDDYIEENPESAVNYAEGVEKADLPKVSTHLLTREVNTGYSSFDQGTGILDSIAAIFPVFFFMIAALVIITTMTRMIDDQRIQIGVMKALGYRNGAILVKYLSYSGSAAAIGAIIGYVLGISLFPSAIWQGYKAIYSFTDELSVLSSPVLAVLTFIVALICAMGSTWYSCIRDFRIQPAQLIRPKSPKPGKRIVLERIGFFWNRLSFLMKVSLRNAFRYRARFIMMLIGISGCTALLVAALGIKTTVSDFPKYQFNEVVNYDYLIHFEDEMDEKSRGEFVEYAGDRIEKVKFVTQVKAEVSNAEGENSLTLVAADEKNFSDFISLHDGFKDLEYPKRGEAVVCRKSMQRLGMKTGDIVTVTADEKTVKLTVSGVCDNYINDYVYISEETYRDSFGKKPDYRLAWICDKEDADEDQIRKNSVYISHYDNFAGSVINVDLVNQVEDMMAGLAVVVSVAIFSAGMLAFIVIFNLTNINIIERVREIATIKVLGFYRRETAEYVFRENIILTAISSLVGIPMGYTLLRFIVSRINNAMIFFVPKIKVTDYLLAIALTFLFAFIVNLVLRHRLDKISMTESLKSVD